MSSPRVPPDDEKAITEVAAENTSPAHLHSGSGIPPDTKEEEDARGSVSSEAGGAEGEKTPSLPFSKAKSIGLVATVTGASFLNVRFLFLLSS
jgi:hypothetical protein